MTFPTINDWYRYVDTCKTVEELNAAVRLLQSARTRCGVHTFERDNKMGLAIWKLRQKGTALGAYELRDGSFTISSTPDVPA